MRGRLLAVLFFAPRALWALEVPDKQTCAETATRGQVLRDESKLTDALQAFTVCSHAACPSVVRESCEGWREDVESRIPTIVVSVRGGSLGDAVRIALDARPVPKALVVPTKLDPGSHTLVLERNAAPPLVQHIYMKEGEKKRSIVFELPTPSAGERAPVPKPEPVPAVERPGEVSRPVPAGVWVLGAASVAAGAAFTYFAVSGRAERAGIDARWQGGERPTQAAEDTAYQKFVLADISLGIASVALAGAVIWFLARPSERREALTRLEPVVRFH